MATILLPYRTLTSFIPHLANLFQPVFPGRLHKSLFFKWFLDQLYNLPVPSLINKSYTYTHTHTHTHTHLSARLFLFLFFERERERVCVSKKGQRERERENLRPVPHPVQSWKQGSIPRPWDHDLSWNQESEARLSHPGAPIITSLYSKHPDLFPLLPLFEQTKLNYLTWIKLRLWKGESKLL